MLRRREFLGGLALSPLAADTARRFAIRSAGDTFLRRLAERELLRGLVRLQPATTAILRGDFIADPPELKKDAPDVTREGPGEDSFHLRNFFDCMRTRKEPNAAVKIGHRSTTVCHLANICRETGHRLRWDPAAEEFAGDDAANAMRARPRRKGFDLPAV